MKLNFAQSFRASVRLHVCLLTAIASIASAQTAGKVEEPEVAALRAEVRRLSLELLQHRLEFAEWKTTRIQTELQQVQAERQRLSAERQLIEKEIGELNQAQISGPGGEDEERKEELNTVQGPALLAGERAAIARETQLVAALAAETGQITEIRKRIQHLLALTLAPRLTVAQSRSLKGRWKRPTWPL